MMPVELDYDYDATTAQMDVFSQKDIDDLREWTQNLNNTKCVPKDLTDKQLVLFYNACISDMEKTKQCIEKYYTYRKNSPELFDNRKVSSQELKPAVENLEFSVLPGKSVLGYDVVFHRLHNTEPSKYQLETGCRVLFMAVDACLNMRGPQPGYLFLFDMRGVKLGHITRLSLSTLRKFFQFVQEAMPVRMREIHILNTEPILDKLLLLIRPFMDKHLFEMIKFHKKNEDMEEFYKNVIPRHAMPADYGGTLPNTRVLHEECMNQLRNMEPYFEAEEAQRKAAIGNKKSKVETSFKRLEID